MLTLVQAGNKMEGVGCFELQILKTNSVGCIDLLGHCEVGCGCCDVDFFRRRFWTRGTPRTSQICRSTVFRSIRTLSLEILLIPDQLVLHLFAHLEKEPSPVTTPSGIKGKITTTVVGGTSNSATYGVSTNATRIQIGPYTQFQLGVIKMQISVIGQ